MDFNATIDLIIKDLDEARKIIDDLKKYQGVPALQVELAKSKCKSAGEIIALLKEMNINGDSTTTADKEIKKTAEVKPTPPPEIKESTVDMTEPVQERKKVDKSAKPEPVNTDAEILMVVEEVISNVKPEQLPDKKIEEGQHDGPILADSFGHLSNRFNEQLGNLRTDDDLTEKIKAQPISSMTEAIGLNDKFLFMKEIFNGDKEAYSQAITRLENASSLADARAVIMSYTGNNSEGEAVKQLIDLVKRKLQSNE
jgi:hypothetical protein